MENTENTEPNEEKLFTPEEIEVYKAKLQEEFAEKEKKMRQEIELEAKKASMSELELAQTELAELKEKYQQKEDECLISKQKEETIVLLGEANLDEDAFNLVFVPKEEEKTKEKIQTLKNYIEKVKKNLIQNYIDAPLPLTSGGQANYDAFIEGFDTNVL